VVWAHPSSQVSPPDTRGKGHQSLYAGFPMPAPRTLKPDSRLGQLNAYHSMHRLYANRYVMIIMVVKQAMFMASNWHTRHFSTIITNQIHPVLRCLYSVQSQQCVLQTETTERLLQQSPLTCFQQNVHHKVLSMTRPTENIAVNKHTCTLLHTQKVISNRIIMDNLKQSKAH